MCDRLIALVCVQVPTPRQPPPRTALPRPSKWLETRSGSSQTPLADTPASTHPGGRARPGWALDSVSWNLPERVSSHFEGPGGGSQEGVPGEGRPDAAWVTYY